MRTIYEWLLNTIVRRIISLAGVWTSTWCTLANNRCMYTAVCSYKIAASRESMFNRCDCWQRDDNSSSSSSNNCSNQWDAVAVTTVSVRSSVTAPWRRKRSRLETNRTCNRSRCGGDGDIYCIYRLRHSPPPSMRSAAAKCIVSRQIEALFMKIESKWHTTSDRWSTWRVWRTAAERDLMRWRYLWWMWWTVIFENSILPDRDFITRNIYKDLYWRSNHLI